MVSIQIDEQTAQVLNDQAQRSGLSISDYLRQLLPLAEVRQRPSWDVIEAEILSLSSAGPSLPPDFSRADIYNDHD